MVFEVFRDSAGIATRSNMSAPMRCTKFIQVKTHLSGLECDSKPIGRSGHCCVTDEGNLYVYGGYNPLEGPPLLSQGPGAFFAPSRQVLVELWKFNIATSSWTKINSDNIPNSAASSSMHLRGRKLFVFGGTVFPFGVMMSNTLYTCDLRNDFSWEAVEVRGTSHEMPPKAYGQSLIFHEDFMYVFAGAVSFNSGEYRAAHMYLFR